MTWKKTWFSVFLWICQLFLVSALLAGTCGIFIDKFEILEKLHILPGSNRLISLGGICLLLYLGLLVVFLIVRLVRNRFGEKIIPGAAKAAIEGLMFIGFLTGGILLRMNQFPFDAGTNAYYDLASVTMGNYVSPMAHGILYVYILLLRALFLLVGNQVLAGIILQLVFHFLAAVFIYVAVRKIAGAFTALWTFAFLMFAPPFVESSLSYTPEALFLLMFGLSMLVVTGILDKVKHSEKIKWYHCVTFLIYGVILSLLVYLDALGIVAVVTCFSVLTINATQEYSSKLNGLLASLMITIGVILGLLGVFGIDALYSNVSLATIANTWSWLYIPEYINISYTYFPIFDKLSGSLIATVFIFVGLICGVYAFWIYRKKEKQNVWMLMAIAGVLMSYVCFASGNMDRAFIAYLSLIILAGKGFVTMFDKQDVYMDVPREIEMYETVENVQVVEQEEIYSEIPVEECAEVVAEMVAEEHTETVEPEEPIEPIEPEVPVQKEIKYIENPLPLPKKHVKKNMDFAIVLVEDQLKYDIEVADDDDFDIQ